MSSQVFRRQSGVGLSEQRLNSNPTGEVLRMTHIARGLDSDGALLLDIVVNGHILQLPSHADISVKVNRI